MSQQALDVSVGKPRAAGGIYAGETSIPAPTDATTALSQALVNLGYVSEDGLVNSIEASTENVTAWGGDTVLTVRTSRNETFTWTFIQTNDAVMSEVYGPDNVSTGSNNSLTVLHNSRDLPRRLYVFEILMTNDRVKRIVVPNAQITEVGDVTYVDGEAIGYEVTLSAFPDDAGNTAYEYIAEFAGGADPAVLATGAEAGAPGVWTPPGSLVPTNLPALYGSGITADPATIWDVGEYVLVRSGASAHWDGSAWVAGESPGA